MTSNPIERRKSRRRPMLDSFSVFLIIPDKAPNRLKVIDVSDLGIGFQLDAETVGSEVTQIKPGDLLVVHLYLNQQLFIPLRVQIARTFRLTEDGPLMAGASINEPYSSGYKAFAGFVQLLDALADLRG